MACAYACVSISVRLSCYVCVRAAHSRAGRVSLSDSWDVWDTLECCGERESTMLARRGPFCMGSAPPTARRTSSSIWNVRAGRPSSVTVSCPFLRARVLGRAVGTVYYIIHPSFYSCSSCTYAVRSFILSTCTGSISVISQSHSLLSRVLSRLTPRPVPVRSLRLTHLRPVLPLSVIQTSIEYVAAPARCARSRSQGGAH